jgi:DNA-binding MarR family transcriptional regulator
MLSRLDGRGEARLSDLAVSIGVDASSLTPRAQRLEREGYIVREADPTDGRASLLRMTRVGKALLSRVHSRRRALYADLLASWSEEDLAMAAKVLVNLADLLDSTTEEANPGIPHGANGGRSRTARARKVEVLRPQAEPEGDAEGSQAEPREEAGA